MFYTTNNPFSKFVNLLDTPSKYEPGKLLIFSPDENKLVAVEVGEVPQFEEAVRDALSNLLQDSDTIDFDIDAVVTAVVKNYSLTANKFRTVNHPFDNAVLLYKDGSLLWASPTIVSNVVEVEARETINVFDPVTSTGYIANNNLPVTNKCMGLAITSGNAGDAVSVLFSGIVTNVSWSWSPGISLFLGDRTITDIAPVTSGKFVQKVGTALDSDTIMVNIDDTVILL